MHEGERYFERIEERLDEALGVAERARERGDDPVPGVEIPVAQDMADRVEKVLGIDGVAERVRELDGQMSREEAALELARDFAEGRVGDYETRAGKVEGAVRTAVALLTEGVVAAPIEGIDRVEVLANDDGTEFVRVFYAGPIRSAGGTAQALSVLVADYTRTLVGLDEYQSRETEVQRYVEELTLYDKETGLQYTPKDAEIEFVARHCPVMLDGEATGSEEVSGYRDLERVDTNNPRGGMCLVLGEGIAQKAPKIKRYTDDLPEVDWPWLDDLIDGIGGEADDDEAAAGADGDQAATEADADDEAPLEAGGDGPADDVLGGESSPVSGPPRPDPAGKYLRDLIAGRPVFSHPSESGGFRLRYGRARNHGFATAGVHPATMHLVDDFLATGTQIKTERPGKAAGVVPVDTIEGPTVKLANGDVRRIDDPEAALEVRNGVDEILDLGEYLVNYGEFVENNHPLAPASYAVEWWVEDLAAAGVDVQALRDAPSVDLADPDAEQALNWALEGDAPLHPAYTYLWHDLAVEQFGDLAAAVASGHWAESDGTLAVPHDDALCDALEALLVEHTRGDETVTIPDALVLVRSLGLTTDLERTWTRADLSREAREWADGENAVKAVNEVAPFAVRERAPTRVGNRMGRPEKSEKREMNPAVHALFPIGEAGGDQRDVTAAARHSESMRDTPGEVDVELGHRTCRACAAHTFRTRCPDCGAVTDPHYECPDCERAVEPDEGGRAVCPRCETEATTVQTYTVDIHAEYRDALERVGERESAFDILKGVKGLSSEHKVPEPLAKGVLRAKNGVSVFKDGTVRYDMTDLPVTSVRPGELDVTAERFRELGYETDVHGDPLERDDQLVELNVQDVVLSDGAADHMLKTADFVDDLLAGYYGLEPFYEFEERDDIVGELVFGMAPHTSAAVVGRVIGFTSAAVGYAHPYFHAAKRRNCFHPETKVWYEDERDEWHYESIRELVEERLVDPQTDDFGTLVQELDDEVYVPSVTEDGNLVRKPVETVSKHPAPDHLVRIETRSGREITVTPDHDIHVFDGDKLVSKRASAVTEDDTVVKPRHLDVVEPSDDPPEFDLLAEFIDTEVVDNDRLMVKGLDRDDLYELFESALAGDWNGPFYPLKSTAEYLSLTKTGLSNYVYRGSFPVSHLLDVFDSTEALIERIPDDVTLGIKRDSTEIDRYVEVNERVATLLGYYAAEGFAREQETSKGMIHQTTLCGTETEARDFYVSVFREAFGVEPYRENEAKVTVSGRLLRTFFDTVLDTGVYADTKRVPQCIFDAPDDIVGAYLSGYFSGDGAVEVNTLNVSATTISRELKEDVFALLTRLGISARTEINDSVPLAEKFPDYYDDDESTSARRYVLHVSSQDAVTFAERVGFHLSRKRDKLRSQIESITPRVSRVFDGGDGDFIVEPVASVTYAKSNVDSTYCLTVEGTHSLIANGLSEKQCDGDEDCVMLLMDGLLNFSKYYLPDRRGGSVAENSRLVAVDPEGEMRFVSFDEFWDELESEVIRDGKFEKKICGSEGWETYTFDSAHRASPMPVERAIRYRADADETLLQIETQFGRSVDITDNHSLFRYDDGIEEVAGEDLSEGDLVVAPRQFDVDPVKTTIDVVECVDDPYVFIDDRVEDLLTTVWETTPHGSPAHAAFKNGLSYRLSKSKIPYDRLAGILDHGGYEGVPETVEVGLKGSSTGIKRTIEVDEEFAWLLGLFVAEGTTSSVCPAIHNSDEELVERTVEVTQSTLDVEPETRWSNRAYEVRFPAVFSEVLYELGFESRESYDSSGKIIPDCILRASEEVVLSFLRGFIAGDGSETTDDNYTSVRFHTTSDDVKDGIVFLLHRLGLVANISEYRERKGNRQPIYSVSVSGGASDNPLHRILDDREPYLPKSLVVRIPESLMEIREMNIPDVKQLVPKYLKRRENVSLEKLREIVEELESRDLPDAAETKLDDLRLLVGGDLSYLRVKNIKRVGYDGYLYDLQVGGDPVFTANWLYAHNSMDAPLVMSSRIDPTEIDDEAHNVDVVESYPREFYEATRRMVDPGEVDVELAGATVGTDRQYAGFRHTHDTSDIAAGPDLSAYKTLEDMDTKMRAQLELARKLRAVDESDVAERVIEYHFLPDLLGNLRAFSRQETRCRDCARKYRRPPLSGDCRECGGEVSLTVYEGSVNKYMETALAVAEEFGSREYTKQRLEILERSLESVFQNDHNKRSTIGDFM